MTMCFEILLSGLMLGLGLAADAFSVSLANGLSEPEMRGRRMCAVAGVFAVFQALMPLVGWMIAHTVLHIRAVGDVLPWLSLALLGYIGGKMLYDGAFSRNAEVSSRARRIGGIELLMQGFATSVDALSVGLHIASYRPTDALLCSALIGAVTLAVCLVGLRLGARLGMALSGKASLLGGCILLLIALRIFLLR